MLRSIWKKISAEHKNRLKRCQLLILALFGGLAIGFLIRGLPILGYDWFTMFYLDKATDIYYPPWTSILLWPLAQLPWRLGLALINGITIATVSVMTYEEGQGQKRIWRVIATLLAVFSLQTLVVLWTGHIDGLAMLGILALPWAAPLVLMKSTFIGFAVFTRKSWFLAAAAFGVISLIVWPGWPLNLINTMQFRNTHPASAGWEKTGWLPVLIGIVLLLKSKRTDIYQAMAAGAFVYPFILPYHHIVLLPALGALKGWRLWIAWLTAWLMILPAGLESYFFVYFIFPFAVWWFRQGKANIADTWLDLLKQRIRSIRSR